jgi:hypothetical protein
MVTSKVATASVREGPQETPGLPPLVYEELRDSFFMDGVMDLLQNPRPRIEMHQYLADELGEFFFLIMQPAVDAITDEFRPTGPASVQSLILTIETATESLTMVHVLLTLDSAAKAEVFIESALESVDQGGPRETKLYLLGIHEVDGRQYQVLLRQETSSTGALLYWIHFY